MTVIYQFIALSISSIQTVHKVIESTYRFTNKYLQSKSYTVKQISISLPEKLS